MAVDGEFAAVDRTGGVGAPDGRVIGTFGQERIQTLKCCAVNCNLRAEAACLYALLAGRT